VVRYSLFVSASVFSADAAFPYYHDPNLRPELRKLLTIIPGLKKIAFLPRKYFIVGRCIDKIAALAIFE
jgi:hypothetical protein